jgi:hypothetical protein
MAARRLRHYRLASSLKIYHGDHFRAFRAFRTVNGVLLMGTFRTQNLYLTISRSIFGDTQYLPSSMTSPNGLCQRSACSSSPNWYPALNHGVVLPVPHSSGQFVVKFRVTKMYSDLLSSTGTVALNLKIQKKSIFGWHRRRTINHTRMMWNKNIRKNLGVNYDRSRQTINVKICRSPWEDEYNSYF